MDSSRRGQRLTNEYRERRHGTHGADQDEAVAVMLEKYESLLRNCPAKRYPGDYLGFAESGPQGQF